MTLVEVLVALVVLAFGLLAMAAMTGAVATQARMAGSVTGQTAAGQQVLEQMHSEDFSTLSGGSRQVTVSSYTYTVDYSVNATGNPDLKEVVAVVDETRDLPPDTMRTLVASMDTVPPAIP